MDLHQKTAIVTGAGRGIGLEICRELSRSGARVVLNDIDADLARGIAEDLGSHCKAVPGDSSDPEVIRELVATAVALGGGLDIAIANAGITLYGDFLNYKREDFFRILEVNLAGSFFLAQAAANQMKQQESGGSLLFMSSVTGHQAHRYLEAYGMTKAALEMLARNLVIELSPLGININAIAPGATITERTMEDPEFDKTWAELTPMGRAASVSDIAAAALFLVSDQARHITGQTLVVDGGWTAVSPSPYEKNE